MMRRAVTLLLLIGILAPALTVSAQDCGAGLPCGPVPWQLPNLPDLSSPTPFPTVLVTSGATVTPTPGPTSTGTITATPTLTLTPSPTSLVDIEALNDSFATLQIVMEATEESVFDRSTGFDLPGNATNVIGLILGLQNVHFGVFTPFIQFIFFGLFFFLGIKVTFFLLPVLMMLVGFIRKIVEFILAFIPG